MSLRLLALALLVVSACQKDAPPPVAPPAEAKEEPEGLDLSTATASKSSDVYEVTLTAPETMPQNEEAQLVISVQAKAGMHVNAEYPINFRPVTTTNSVKYSKTRFDLLGIAKKTPCEQGKGKDFCTLTAPVPFTVDVVGPRRIEGILAFSVCDKNRCLIEKATLGMDVAAK
jgi:hypothetical protein